MPCSRSCSWSSTSDGNGRPVAGYGLQATGYGHERSRAGYGPQATGYGQKRSGKRAATKCLSSPPAYSLRPTAYAARQRGARMSAPVLSVRGIVNRFGDQVVHDGVDLDVNEGEVLGIVGGSGSGKSVLLRTM